LLNEQDPDDKQTVAKELGYVHCLISFKSLFASRSGVNLEELYEEGFLPEPILDHCKQNFAVTSSRIQKRVLQLTPLSKARLQSFIAVVVLKLLDFQVATTLVEQLASDLHLPVTSLTKVFSILGCVKKKYQGEVNLLELKGPPKPVKPTLFRQF